MLGLPPSLPPEEKEENGGAGGALNPLGEGVKPQFSVSSPYQIKHPVHVDFNSATGFQVI